jgi:hypothetical protein
MTARWGRSPASALWSVRATVWETVGLYTVMKIPSTWTVNAVPPQADTTPNSPRRGEGSLPSPLGEGAGGEVLACHRS